MYQAVIRPSPDGSLLNRRLDHREDHVVVLDARVVLCDWTAGRALLGAVVASQVSADYLPALPFIRRFVQVIARGVKHLRIVRRKDYREIPLETIFQIGRRMTHWIVGPRINVALLMRAMVVPGNQASVRTRINNVGVARIGSDPSALAAAYVIPVRGRYSELVGAARDLYRRVVLLRSIHVIREVIIESDAIELRRSLILRRPGSAAVGRDVCAAVVRIDHAQRIVWRDPEIMIVSMRNAYAGISPAAVHGFIEAGVENVDRVDVDGIGIDASVVPCALPEITLFVDSGPGLSSVVGSEYAALIRFYDGPYALGINRRHGNADIADRSLRQSLVASQFRPGISCIG